MKRTSSVAKRLRVLVLGSLIGMPAQAWSAEVQREGASQSTEPVAALALAEKLFEAGTVAFEAGDYGRALEKMRQAFELSRDYRFAAGLGQVELHLGQFRNAAAHLDFSLRNFPEAGGDSGRRHVMAGLAEARRRTFSVAIRTNLAGASLSVDGVVVEQTPLEHDLYIEPGERRIRAEAPGYEPFVVELFGPAGGHKELVFELVPIAPRSTPKESALTPAAWTWIVGGAVTVVAAGVGTVLYLDSRADNARAEDINAQLAQKEVRCLGSSLRQCRELKDVRDSAATHGDLAALALGVSGVSLLATVGVFGWLQLSADGSGQNKPSAGTGTTAAGWALSPQLGMSRSGKFAPSATISGRF
ncbi:MAG: hypothetical protein RJA70_3285 [Pseudomonadota bacterium]